MLGCNIIPSITRKNIHDISALIATGFYTKICEKIYAVLLQNSKIKCKAPIL